MVPTAVWREGHGPSQRRWSCATSECPLYLTDRPHESRVLPTPGEPQQRVKPLLIPMTSGQEPFVFHGQFTPDRVGLWEDLPGGWGDPIHTWRHGLMAKARCRPGGDRGCPTTCW